MVQRHQTNILSRDTQKSMESPIQVLDPLACVCSVEHRGVTNRSTGDRFKVSFLVEGYTCKVPITCEKIVGI
jgi:hypothetical protein